MSVNIDSNLIFYRECVCVYIYIYILYYTSKHMGKTLCWYCMHKMYCGLHCRYLEDLGGRFLFNFYSKSC